MGGRDQPNSRKVSPPVELHSDRLSATIDPVAGGCVRSLRDRHSGIELLVQTPPPTAPVPAPPADPDRWTRAWPGGWHLLFPNAGEPCTVHGVRHGFHGAASISRWDVLASDTATAQLAWRDQSGLAVTRQFALKGNVLRVRNDVTNGSSDMASFIIAEHLIFGPPLVGPGMYLGLAGGRLIPMTDTGQHIAPAADALEWPYADRGAGLEDWSNQPEQSLSRFGAVTELTDAEVAIRNGSISVSVSWDMDPLPNLWLWHENAGPDTEADGITCLGVEPASVAHSLGLANAIESNEAVRLAPHETWHSDVRVSVGG